MAEKKNPLTLEQAKNLRAGQELFSYEMTYRGRRCNEPIKVKITSVKTWKTRPTEILVKAQFGLYDHWSIYENHLKYWTTDRNDAKKYLAEADRV